MRVLFMGTPDFAVPSLDIISKSHDVVGIFTKIDKPNQRGKKIRFTPVKQYALDNNIEVYQPNSVKTKDTLDLIRELKPDIIIVVAYGKILPQELIDIPKYGVLNVHSSLLPKYRGAAPIHNAIINGDEETGVTIMYIAEELDAGDMIIQAKTPIYEEDNLETVHDRLAEIGAEALSEAVKLIGEGKAPRIPQDYSKATFVGTIKKEDTRINWNDTKENIFNFVRGMNPFPCSFTTMKKDEKKKLFKIYAVEKLEEELDGEAGTIVKLIKDKGPVVKVGNGAVVLTSVKPENKRILKGQDLINGNYFTLNDRFEVTE